MNCLTCLNLRREMPVGCKIGDMCHIDLTDNEKHCNFYSELFEIKKPVYESLRYKNICLFDNFAIVQCIETGLYHLDVYSENYITRYEITALIKKGGIE